MLVWVHHRRRHALAHQRARPVFPVLEKEKKITLINRIGKHDAALKKKTLSYLFFCSSSFFLIYVKADIFSFKRKMSTPADVLINEELTRGMSAIQMPKIPVVLPAEMIENETLSQEEWARRCYERWEDIEHLLRSDPYMSRFANNGNPDWAVVYREMKEMEKKFLSSRESGNRQYHILLQPPTVRFAAEDKKQSAETDTQAFDDVILVGCTNRYALVWASTRKHPDRFDLYRADLRVAELRCQLAVPKREPHGANREHNIATRVASHFQYKADESNPVFQPIHNSKANSKPLISCVSIETGIVCFVCEQEQSRIYAFNAHANEDEPVRLGSVALEAGVPDQIACSGAFMALLYRSAHGRARDTGQYVPASTNDEGVVQLPPFVYVLPLPSRGAEVQGKIFVLPSIAADPKAKAAAEEQQKACAKLCMLEFHDDLDNVLNVSAADEAIWTLKIDLKPDGMHLDIHHEPSFLSVHAKDLMNLYRRNKDGTIQLTDSERAVLENKKRHQGYRVIRQRLVGPKQRPEHRVLAIGSADYLSTRSGSAEQAEEKIRAGKQPATYLPMPAPFAAVHNCGNVTALHRAPDNAIILMNFATNEAFDCITPAQDENGSAVIEPCENWLPTLRVFSNRICALLPGGYLLFLEADTEEYTKRYQEIRSLVVQQLVQAMKLEKSLSEARQPAKGKINVQSSNLKDEEDDDEPDEKNASAAPTVQDKMNT